MYSQGVAQYYDLFADAAEPGSLPEATFVRALLPHGSSVLDIGAGTGTLAFALAADGYKVTVLEPDVEMYAALLVRLAGRADLRQQLTPLPKPLGFDLGERFDACLSLAVLHLLDAPARAKMFQYAAAHLRDGGRCVVEVPVESPLREELAHQLKAERTIGATRFQHYYSMRRTPGGRWCTTWEFLAWRHQESLDRRTREFDWKPSSLDELTTLATQAGLRVDETFGGFDRSAYVEGQSRILLAVLGRAHR
ncbi:MAG TPA: class I SAM-dependent methyltransferase [Burkholderiaceae bacterium]|nr:class I SAM-dependent methyltransferase [Burkholderiaceae bacterium]